MVDKYHPTVHGMTRERYIALTRDPDIDLTTAEIEAGWHFCYEWDFMLIHESDDEYKACRCNFNSAA